MPFVPLTSSIPKESEDNNGLEESSKEELMFLREQYEILLKLVSDFQLLEVAQERGAVIDKERIKELILGNSPEAIRGSKKSFQFSIPYTTNSLAIKNTKNSTARDAESALVASGSVSGYTSSCSASNSPSASVSPKILSSTSCANSSSSTPSPTSLPRSHSSCSSEGSLGAGGNFAIDPFASANDTSVHHHLSSQMSQNESSFTTFAASQQHEYSISHSCCNSTGIIDEFGAQNEAFVVTFLKCEWDFDDKGKDVSRYYFSIKPPKAEGWIIVKKIREFIDLESSLKKNLSKPDYEKYGKIGDKGVLTGASPSSRSLKKTALEFYLTHLLSRMPLHSSIMAFVAGNRVNEKDILLGGQTSHQSNYIKEGFLLKKGSFFTPWIVRYYRLKSMRLDYYQTKYGPVQGSIKLPLLSIWQYNSDPDYKHAFVLENKQQQFQVILCCENDTERDEWIYHIKNVIRDAALTVENATSSFNNSTSTSTTTNEYPTTQIRSDAESIYYVGNEDAPPPPPPPITPSALPKDHRIPFVQKGIFSKVFGGSNNMHSSREESIPFDDSRSISFENTHDLHLNASSSASTTQQFDENCTKIFGVPLKQAVGNSGEPYASMHVPRIVQQCIEYLEEQEAFLEEGIYRLSGSSASIKNLRERCDSDPLNFMLSAYSPDIHVVSGLLKLYFRELPENIICQNMDNFDSSFLGTTALEEQNSLAQSIVERLSLENKATLKSLFGHLKNVVDNCLKNKMTVKNIAIVFSATLSVPSWMFLALLNGASEGTLRFE